MKDGKPWLPDEVETPLEPRFKPYFQDSGAKVPTTEEIRTFRPGQIIPLPPGVNPCEVDPNWISPHTPGAKLDKKDGNPKEMFANNKLHLDVVPGCMEQYCSLALLEGALKYGRYNWRVDGVRVSTYISAAKRHLDKYLEGQWADPKSKVPHLASVLACVTIILDAGLMGTLEDDRAPSLPNHDQWIDEQSEIVKHLQQTFQECHPRQYTIADVIHASNAEATCPRQ